MVIIKISHFLSGTYWNKTHKKPSVMQVCYLYDVMNDCVQTVITAFTEGSLFVSTSLSQVEGFSICVTRS